MAWISIENLGLYHQKLKDWIAKLKINASNIIQDDNNKLVTKAQVESWENKLDANANAVSASKLQTPVNINGIPFDGSEDITINVDGTSSFNVNIVEMELPKATKIISVSNLSTIMTDEKKLWLFIDGIKLIKDKHYKINVSENNITINEAYSSTVNVEVIIFQ